MSDFFIHVNEDSLYPSSNYHYSPDTFYPEYPWSSTQLSQDKNIIYEMVRESFIGLKMDEGNFGTPQWNPLGTFIKEGNTVVVKPNWVMDKNKNSNVKENSLECMITHPSIVRVVIDYCLIALNGTGKLIVGDAPMQGCNLDNLIEISGYKKVFEFYNYQSLDIQPTDFRQYASIFDNNKVIIGKKFNITEAIEIDLNRKSRFADDNSSHKKYKVSDYNEKLTNSYHNNAKHSYLINKDVLSANVIINLPKPKCHRLAGITSALKNFVGVTYDKVCLPHRTVGSKQAGGDEYLYNSSIKKLISTILQKKIIFEEQNKHTQALLMRYSYGILYYVMNLTKKDKYLIGSWYGNDTIWRTVLDLYYILLYADKNGILRTEQQRKIFNIADMIISGERNGPVAPEPKKIGVIMAGYDAVIMDLIICEIMGFDYEKVPSIFYSLSDHNLTKKSLEFYECNSNKIEFNKLKIKDLKFPSNWKFIPHDAWIGHIEKF